MNVCQHFITEADFLSTEVTYRNKLFRYRWWQNDIDIAKFAEATTTVRDNRQYY